jgi:hypothetical protein
LHYHLTNLQFFIGGFALIIAILLALAAIHDLRPKKTQPFRNYFYSYSENDGDLLEQSSFSDPEEWRAGEQPLIDDFDFYNVDSTERLTTVRESTPQHRE